MRWRPLIIAALAPAVFATTAASPVPAAQVEAAVRASLSITVIPSNLTPSVQQVSTKLGYYQALSTRYVRFACDAQVNPPLVTHPVACFYGDTKATRTVILYGDSNAGNWAPALDLAFRALKIRLALLSMPSCASGFMTYTVKQMEDPQACKQWHSNLEPYARSLHPIAVLLSSVGWLYPSLPGWFPAINAAFSAITGGDPRVKRILMGTSPDFPQAVPQCLAAFPGSVQACTLSYANPRSAYASDLRRDGKLATYAHAALQTVSQWLCYAQRCPTVVRNMLVYVDRDHLSITYSHFLTGVFGQAMARDLPPAHRASVGTQPRSGQQRGRLLSERLSEGQLRLVREVDVVVHPGKR